MRFLVSMVFVGMLALSSQAFAFKNSGTDAIRIIMKGKVVAKYWDTTTHHTRVIYKGTYYACKTYTRGDDLVAL